ncbi:MAG TPA: hypothetical protein VKX17_14950 [Planctomycetota bacterium]|nr:hypothetical protein [Planctomycetota bacterium]
MPEPPRRARFQIHLSTAIVLMFVAGGLIWLNVLERSAGMFLSGPHIIFAKDCGWPCFAWTKVIEYFPLQSRVCRPSYIGICINLVVALAILFAVYFLCESLIRRRAARKKG